MKKSVYLFAFCAMFACKRTASDLNAGIEKADNSNKSVRTTYAEISIKEGGHWEGRSYMGDNFTFKNVDFLRAPDSLTDHSYYVRYEGPGWESSKVGYRIYFDWRNAIDIFGKKVDTMVLSKVGLDNYDSYHEDAPWGQDILKAGKSLGIGSYGKFDGKDQVAHFQQVDSTTARIHNRSEGSGVTLNYYGWTVGATTTDLTSELFIAPDSRLTKVTLSPSKELEGLCTGIIKFPTIETIQKKDDNGWAYLATYGEQSLVPDQLGLVIFYRMEDVAQITEAEYDHLIVFKPSALPVTYYLGAAWEKEKDGITSEDAFKAYLDAELAKLN